MTPQDHVAEIYIAELWIADNSQWFKTEEKLSYVILDSKN